MNNLHIRHGHLFVFDLNETTWERDWKIIHKTGCYNLFQAKKIVFSWTTNDFDAFSSEIVNIKLSIVWEDWYPLVYVQHFRKRIKIKFPHLPQLIFITAIITFMLLLKSRFQFHFSFDLADFFPRLTRLLLLRFSAYFSQPTLTLSSTTSILSRKPRATSPEVFK